MRDSRKVLIGVTSATILAASTTLVTQWEGIRPKPYVDIVGTLTVCIGQTAADGIDLHRTYTVAECKAMLQKSLARYDDEMKRCVGRDMPDSVHVAFISVTYNIGWGGFCKSSMAKHARAGEWRAACDALLMWNRAGGRVVKGLDNRRKAERKVCLEGI